jgi:carbon-monoxide dehydrogenase large subunit
VRGSAGRSVTLREIASAAYAGARRLPKGMEPGLEATRFYDPYFGSASSAAHVAVVEVDVETGVVAVRKYAITYDVGRAVNPLIVDGQLVGALAQGLGGALLEELAYDEQGQILTTTLMDYLLPTAMEMPDTTVVRILEETPTPLNPLGVKGAGEGGSSGCGAAIANAVADALAPLGVHVTALPLSPDRVLGLIRAARPEGGRPEAPA